jgi:hypothetical protein
VNDLSAAHARLIKNHLNSQQTGGAGFESPTPGMMSVFGGPTLPAGYIQCNGQAVSRQQYSRLFRAINTTHGAGNGTTTFNVPNLASPGAGMVWAIRS